MRFAHLEDKDLACFCLVIAITHLLQSFHNPARQQTASDIVNGTTTDRRAPTIVTLVSFFRDVTFLRLRLDDVRTLVASGANIPFCGPLFLGRPVLCDIGRLPHGRFADTGRAADIGCRNANRSSREQIGRCDLS